MPTPHNAPYKVRQRNYRKMAAIPVAVHPSDVEVEFVGAPPNHRAIIKNREFRRGQDQRLFRQQRRQRRKEIRESGGKRYR